MAATVDGAAGTRATAPTSFSRLREHSFVLVLRVRAPSSHLRSRPRLAATAPDPTIGTREHHGSPTPGLCDPDRLRCAPSLPFFFSRESPSFGSHDTEPYRRGTRRDRSRRTRRGVVKHLLDFLITGRSVDGSEYGERVNGDRFLMGMENRSIHEQAGNEDEKEYGYSGYECEDEYGVEGDERKDDGGERD
ncbi:hypothetical protein DEO72_LG10g2947 [Vigna unguiculata]|uniref:Uncharacterized protein n=1 Tax=Vigna unguiculata TaxID=3917 RepID=A0A4D6NFJ9_VIGUN|nr:hypothetical protein DEO72_LG10g2947 [Vigna unguiculata]